ncbi:MAG: DUF2207 domain-containing protein, partial [Actinomycetes bacterium]
MGYTMFGKKKRRKARKRRTPKQRLRRNLLIWVPIILVVGFFWKLAYIIPSNSDTFADTVKMTSYAAEYTVDANGGMTAVEVVTGQFPNGKHGIFRYWDATDPRNPGIRYQTTVTSVTRDGNPERYELLNQSADRYLVAKIGDPDALLTAGQHVYQIRYSVTGVITPVSAGPVPTFVTDAGESTPSTQSMFWWNVVANGWRMAIDKADIKVHLPSPSTSVQCTAVTAGSGSDAHGEGPCTLAGAGTANLTISATKIPAFGGLTVRAGMALPPPPVATVPWPWWLDPALGRSTSRLLQALLLVVAALLVGFGWAFATREREPGLPVLYEPPKDLGPVQTIFACEETTGDHDLAASVFHLANLGLLKVEAKSRSWRTTATTPLADAAERCDPVSVRLLKGLGLDDPGDGFSASGSVASGRKLNDTRKEIGKSCRRWSADVGLTRVSAIGLTGRIVWWVAVVAVFACFTTWWTPTAWALIPLAFVGGGYRLMAAGATRRRTRAGREMWSRAGGFRRMLATPSSELRFDFAARKEMFLPYLPYAVAFGVAKEWAQKYEDELNEKPEMPTWYNSSATRVTTATLINSVGSFESQMTST